MINNYSLGMRGKLHSMPKRMTLLFILFISFNFQFLIAQNTLQQDEHSYVMAEKSEIISDELFTNFGWSLAVDPPIAFTPNQVSNELGTNEILTQEITVRNTSSDSVFARVSSSSNSILINTISIPSFTLAAGEETTFTIELNSFGAAKGFYEESLVFIIDEFPEIVRIPVNTRVTDGTEVPILVLNPNSFSETIEQLQIVTRDLRIQNTGDGPLNYTITVNDTPQSTVNSRITKTNEFIDANGFQKESSRISNKLSPKKSQAFAIGNTLNRMVTNLFATDFEDYTIGDLDGQFGWSTSPDTWTVSDANPFAGEKAIQLQSAGNATRALAFTPSITPGNQPFMVASATINIEGSGVTWEFIPQSNTTELVTTRVRFNPDNTIDIFDEDIGDFTRINTTTPRGYFNIRVIVDKDDAALSVFFDDNLVYSGRAATNQIEQIVLLSEMESTTATMDVDTIEIIDGDENAFFLSVSPIVGTIDLGEEATLKVKFDTRGLDIGEYSASINIVSDDPRNATIDIPVTLTVLAPPTIAVNPNNLSAEINVQTDNPATKTEVLTITNSGQANLDFTTAIGATTFTPPTIENTRGLSLDLSRYGVENTIDNKLKVASKNGIAIKKIKNNTFKNDENVVDSIAYDTGKVFPDDFVGFNNGTASTVAVKFDVDRNFTLTAIRNAYQTEASTAPIILEIYEGGATPADGTLLLTQTITTTSTDGIFATETLNESFSFSNGDSFWVVHKYASDINFPQGIDDGAPVRPNTYFISDDGGASYNSTDFVFLTRALNTQTTDYITLQPSEGSLAPGESIEVTVTFDAENLANGNYTSDILVSSNDPVTPTTTVTTSLDVSGQTSFIELSEEFILFNNVFIGNNSERTITLSNSGLSQINVSSISSDNVAFSVTPINTVIAAGESIDITVKFTPNITGNSNGIITIDSDASNASSLQVIVNGVGVAPPIAVLDPANISETVDAGQTVDTQLSLKNEGKAPLFFSFPDLAVAAALAKPNVKLNDTKILNFSNFSTQKGTKDTRVGSPVISSIGTDNGFGYTWIDSDESGGPIYNFIDISGTGTEITTDLGGDGSLGIPLLFPFEFYGNTYTNATVNANGFISFDESPSLTFVNSQIPVDNGVNNMIAGLWDDLEPQNFNGAVHYQTIDNTFIVQWTNASVFLGSENETVTFQIVLHADGNIDVFYEDVETASFLNSTTVGIENADASDGAQVVFNSDYIKNGLALRFIKPDVALTPFISNISPISGVVPAGGSRDLTVTLDATNLNDSVYFDELTVSSNSPDISTSTSLIELTVKGFPEIQVSRDSIAFEPIFIGLQSSTDFVISNTGTKALDVNFNNQNSDFTIETTSSLPILPGGSKIVTVNFAPTVVGSIDDILVITSNDAFGNESVSIPLIGVGIDPPVINVIPDSLNITLKREKTTTEIVTIENTGGSILNYSLVKTPFTTNLTNNVRKPNYTPIEFEQQIITKEQTDNRIGPKFLNASGGPGTFGYIWTDNNSGGPAYDFIDISETGTLASVGADGNETITLPFTFNFFGEDQESITIAANGFLTFAPITASFGAFLNQQIPSTGNPNNLIAGLWDDLEPQDGEGVFYQAFEDYFIVQYEEVPGFGSNPVKTPVTFQIILFKDGSIKMQYKNVNSEISTSATVGLEGPNGENGLQVIFNTEFLTNELAITYTPPIMGSVAPGSTAEVPLEFSAAGLEADTTYNADILISSNDPATSEVTVPVTLNVLETIEIVSFTLVDTTTNTEIGIINDGDIIDLNDYNGLNNFSIIANTGTLDITSVVFDFNEETGFNTENRAPFSLKGDFNGNIFRGVTLPLGSNTITATPFEERNGQGETGISNTITFEVIDSNPPTVTDFLLIDATKNAIIGALNEGDTIDLADFRRNNFSVVANTTGSRVESVIFDFNDRTNFNTENSVPYSLNGDITFRRTNYFGTPFSIGTNTITATPFRNDNGKGDNGSPVTINFEVIDSDAPVVTSLTLINAITNEEIGQLNEGDTINIADFNSNNFSILANTEGNDTRSVVFGLNNRNRFKVENFAPYSIGGDFGGNFFPIKFSLGRNTVTATPYKKLFGKGKPGTTVSVAFNVINDNATADKNVIGQISPNPVIDIATVTLKENDQFKVIDNMNLKASIHTLSGFTISQSVNFSLDEQKRGRVDVSNLPSGIYILKVTDVNNQIISRIKLIKK